MSRQHVIHVVIVAIVVLVLFQAPVSGQSAAPAIRPLRRLITDFELGRRASLMVVVQMVGEFQVRWFLGLNNRTLPRAEFPHTVPIDGDARFTTSETLSFDVHAISLTMSNLPNNFPFHFYLVFTGCDDNANWQYRLISHVADATSYRLERLDGGISWLHAPSPTVIFDEGGSMQMACSVRFRNTGEELGMYRNAIMAGGEEGGASLQEEVCVVIHENRKRLIEDTGKYRNEGDVVTLRAGYKRYRVYHGVQVNATPSADQGLYMCKARREYDRSAVSFWVRGLNNLPGIDRPYVLDIIPCTEQAAHWRDAPVTINANHYNCIRCRALGYSRATILLTKNGTDVKKLADVHVDEHVNVDDGGVSEVTLWFTNPQPAVHDGPYVCHAFPSQHVRSDFDRVQFDVIVTPASSNV